MTLRSRVVRFLLRLVLLAGVLTALLVAGNVGWALLTVPPLPPGGFNPERATTVYDRTGKAVGPLTGHVFRIPVPYGQMPEHLRKAFVASEDVRFYQHPGVDLRGILRALVADLRAGEIREGGSTITQQVIKNTMLTPRQTLRRKVQEMVLALALERRYSKDEILSIYLNQVYLGGGAYGVGAAARLYFDKNVSELTLGESALLAGLTPAPERYNPFRNPELAVERRNTVLDRMVAAGYLDAQEAAREKARPLRVSDRQVGPEPVEHPWFMDAIWEELERRYGLDERMVSLMGLKVYTTLDPQVQKAAEQAIARRDSFPRGVPDGLEVAVAALDPQSGEVRALVGGRSYTVRQGLNRATDARRSPGSAIKPVLVYAPAFEVGGFTPDSKVADTPLDLGGYRPRNHDGRFRGLVTIREAARLSLNVPAVRLLGVVGVDTARRVAERLGIPFAPSDRSLALALGGMTRGVTPLELAASYQAFANGGFYHEPHLILRVEAADGVLPARQPFSRRALKPRTAYWVTEILREALHDGTGRAARLDRPAAGKTGTAGVPDTPEFEGIDGNTDVWFVGYTPDLVTVVWMGYDRTDRQHFIPASVQGGTAPARLWRQIMVAALAGRPPREFPGPDGRLPPPRPAPGSAPGSRPTPPPPTFRPLPAIVGLTAGDGPWPGTVSLSWRIEPATPAGREATGDGSEGPSDLRFLIFRGTTPDVPSDPSMATGIVSAPPAVDLPPGPGTYYYRVVAVEVQTGRTGPPSPVIAVQFRGRPGAGLPGVGPPGAGTESRPGTDEPGGPGGAGNLPAAPPPVNGGEGGTGAGQPVDGEPAPAGPVQPPPDRGSPTPGESGPAPPEQGVSGPGQPGQGPPTQPQPSPARPSQDGTAGEHPGGTSGTSPSGASPGQGGGQARRSATGGASGAMGSGVM